jgi:hypothetical protein
MFTFVPFGADSSEDYAIVFTEDTFPSKITGNTSVSCYVDKGEEVEIEITPEVTGQWTFVSWANPGIIGSRDTRGYLYNAEGNCIADDDDAAGETQFCISMWLEGGKTYVLKYRWFDQNNAGVIGLIAHAVKPA